MKRLLTILLLAVVLPSVVLAWLALRSLRDQQFILERQQALLHQEIVDGLARDVNNLVLGWQADFAQTVRRLEAEHAEGGDLPAKFDTEIRAALPWAEVGFATDARQGLVLSPQPERNRELKSTRDAAGQFLADNSGFLNNREPALVFTSLSTPYQPSGITPRVPPPAEDSSVSMEDAVAPLTEKLRSRLASPKSLQDKAPAGQPAPEPTSGAKASRAETAPASEPVPLPARLEMENAAPGTGDLTLSKAAEELPAATSDLAIRGQLHITAPATREAGADLDTPPLQSAPIAGAEAPAAFSGTVEAATGSGTFGNSKDVGADRGNSVGNLALSESFSDSAAVPAPPADQALSLEFAPTEAPVDGLQEFKEEEGAAESESPASGYTASTARQKAKPRPTVILGGRSGNISKATPTEPPPSRRAFTKKDFSERQSYNFNILNSQIPQDQEAAKAAATAPAKNVVVQEESKVEDLAESQKLQQEQAGEIAPAVSAPAASAPAPAAAPAPMAEAMKVTQDDLKADAPKQFQAGLAKEKREAALPPLPATPAAPAYKDESRALDRRDLDWALPTVTLEGAEQRQAALRNVSPQQSPPVLKEEAQVVSSVRGVESDFATIIQGAQEGCIARLQKAGVSLLLWRRSERDPEVIYGVQISGATLLERAKDLVWVDEPLSREVCLALLDHGGKPIAQSKRDFGGNWRKPFVATEIGDILPYWEAALYLVDPLRLTHSAQTLRWTLGGMVVLLVGVIAVGAVFVSREVAQRMFEARQKTDFVSNVSHELKTPLTSIRMFSELLAENRVQDADRQKQYLNIIVSEAGRLTRLINNVLDFSRMERGEKRYRMEGVELGEQLREVAGMLTPNLQEQGLRLQLDVPADRAYQVFADADALAQVWVNLISNAEKYASGGKEISVRLETAASAKEGEPRVRVIVEDRGPGVPRGLEKRIFQQFYRVDDSLAANVQGSGLGLTLARQIVEAHRGRIWYEPRIGGGSRFMVELPVLKSG